MPIKVLLPRISKEDQTVGNAMRRMHQIQTNQQQPNPTKDDQQYGTRLRSRRYSRNRHIAEFTKLRGIPKHCHDD